MKKSYTATFKAQVVLELLKETKTLSQLTSEYGVHATVLRDWKQAALKGLPDVFERRALVEHDADALPLGTQADLLSISRRSLYYQPKPPPPEEVAIKHRIDELYTAHPFYGSRKLTVLLEEHFAPINRKRVQRYMREMGIAGIAPGPNLSKRLTDDRVYPYLLRDITAQHPNHIWGCDITYIRLRHGWLYLVAIIDWFSRYVISWLLDETLEIGFVLEAIGQARAQGIPQIWNTDQGSHFTSPQVTQPLEAAGVQ